MSADAGRPGSGATTEGWGDGAAPPGAADAGDGAGAFVSGGGETDGCATASAAAARAGQSNGISREWIWRDFRVRLISPVLHTQ